VANKPSFGSWLKDLGDGTFAEVVAEVAVGNTTDAAASSTEAEAATARTGIGLLKGVKNVLLLIKTALGGGLPAALAASGGLKVDLTASNLAAGSYMGEVGNTAFVATAKITRPANVTQYTAGDVVGGAALEFDVARQNGGGGWINNAIFVSDNAPTATGQFFAWIFSAAPTVAADNVAFAPSDAELRTLVAFLTLDAAKKTANNTAYQQSDPRATYFVCGAATQSLWIVITDGNAYTPANGEVLDLTLFGTQE